MSSNRVNTQNMKLEVLVLPVSDVDRSKNFYQTLGWRLDADFVPSEDFRVVQLTPPGSEASIIFVTVVAPGLFSTDFLSTESYVAAKTIIDDYQETVGPMRSGASALHGNQPGDPKKFASVMIQLANTERPPLHLPVGQDAIAMYQNNAAKMAQEIEAWLPVATSTDHDHRIAA